MKKLFRALMASLVVCLGLPVGAAAVQNDPFHKEGRGKLSYELDRIARESERGGPVRSMSRAYDKATGKVTVVMELKAGASPDGVKAVVQAAGGRVEGVAGNLVKAILSPSALREVAAHPDVRLMRAPFRPTPKKAGAATRSRRDVISQGVNVIGADAYIARTGADGSGIIVGVLDGAFQGAVDLLGAELPADTAGTEFVLSHLDAEGIHGTACAEIVHDVAPGAKIFLGASDDEVVWANQIDELIGGGARIISHSLGWDNLGPPDGNSFWTQKVDAAAARGVLFVTAAGNEGQNYFQTRWQDLNRNGRLDFAPDFEVLPFVAIPSGTTVRLRWDDPFDRSNHDYDLVIVTPDFLANPDLSEGNPSVVVVSADVQNGGGDPLETVSVTAPEPTLLFAVVVHDATTPENANQRFYLWVSTGLDPAIANPASSLSTPGDARGALTVGAVAWDSRGLEGYSSRGPTADNRVKPDLVGPDQVTTVSYGEGAFPGTSAATPHVAGAAALILSRNPSLSLASLRQALERATTSGGSTAAKNNDFGFGLIDLSRAP
jgi:subtilisin family serine protease